MATNVERVQQLFGAIRHEVVTPAKAGQMAQPYIEINRQRIIEAGYDPDNLTAEQSAWVVLAFFRDQMKSWAKQSILYESNTNAQASIISAMADYDEV